jgi:hypothetical protein
MIDAINDDSFDKELLEIDNDPLSSVWPVFLFDNPSKILVQQRLLNSGKKQYKHPVENTNSEIDPSTNHTPNLTAISM